MKKNKNTNTKCAAFASSAVFGQFALQTVQFFWRVWRNFPSGRKVS